MRYNFKDEFAHFSNVEINQNVIGIYQRRLLQSWFGRGADGARAAHGKTLPSDLDVVSLRAYHEIARRQIEDGHDHQGTQRERLDLIEEALEELGN